MHYPCIDLYPVAAVPAHHNPYSHPRIEQRQMRTKLLLGVFRRHQLSRSHITPIRVALYDPGLVKVALNGSFC